MKKVLFIPILLLVFFSCSPDEETQVPTNTVQTTTPEPEPDTIQTDTDGDGVVDSLDDFPLNSTLTEDLWGQIVNFEPELFFAGDVSENAQEQFRKDLNLGIAEWGNYGPLEYWILGNDINAALELANLYCEKRTSRGELWYFHDSMPLSELQSICLSEKMHPHADLGWNKNISDGGTYFTGDLSNYTGGFESYREVSDNLPSMNAVGKYVLI